ncbi:uncharacterized protein [Coffea arabica]|uniref:Uncharacterized protein isoform X3 n=1 Tax=Coffea arabica TaxID=13443 RepID=A0ABM4W6V1_COFAR
MAAYAFSVLPIILRFGDKMSFLIDILKRILGIKDEERDINQQQNLNQRHYDFQRPLDSDSFSRSRTSLAQTTANSRTNEVYNANKSGSNFNEHLVPGKLSRDEVGKSMTSSTGTGIGDKNLRVVSQSASPSFVLYDKQPSISAKPREVLKNPNEITQNRNGLFSSKGTIPQTYANITSGQKSSFGISSASYKSFQSSKLSPSEAGTEKLHSTVKTDSPSSYPSLADSCSQKPPPLSTKPVLSLASTSSTSPQTKTKYIWVDKGAPSTYVFPENISALIEKDIVPGVLKMPLSMSTYMDYFQALLYAEDCHLEGVIYRVVKSNLVLAEFGESFYSQHRSECKYDVKFSFNRVCLKRAHQAIAAVSSALFRNFLFPDLPPENVVLSTQYVDNRYQKANFVVHQILRLQGAPPYLVEGPMCIERDHLSRTGVVIVEAALQILRLDPSKKILLCAPINRTCDLLMRGLKKEISDSDMFRANAAFRELDGIPVDILPSCLYESQTECFSCPSLEELGKFKIILSTFMSSFKLHSEGVKVGHFSHIFLVDASSATEPETMVPLANFANDKTIVVVTGAPRNHSGWIRSKIARENGLLTSYFERLRKSDLYNELDPKVITQLDDNSTERYRSPLAFGI